MLYISWLASTTFSKLWIPLSILLFIAALPKDFGMNSNPFYHPLARDFLEDVKLKIKKLKSQTELMYFSYQLRMYMCYILLKYKCGQCHKIDIRDDTFLIFMKRTLKTKFALLWKKSRSNTSYDIFVQRIISMWLNKSNLIRPEANFRYLNPSLITYLPRSLAKSWNISVKRKLKR